MVRDDLPARPDVADGRVRGCLRRRHRPAAGRRHVGRHRHGEAGPDGADRRVERDLRRPRGRGLVMNQ